MPLPLCVRVEDEQSARSLEKDGWREIETLEIWQGEVGQIDTPGIRKAEQKDLEFCMELARSAFTHDRLHSDNSVPDGIADKEKAQFVMKAFNCPKYDILVAPLIGFAIFTNGAISLIAVQEDRRRRGWAQLLCHQKGGFITAGTQASNAPAKRLYRSLGMDKVQELRTFHKNG